MDPTTASYYRAILFRDSQDSRPLPQSLLKLHAWSYKTCLAMGIGSIIPKQTALAVALTWLSSTDDGRAFAQKYPGLEDLFDEPEQAVEAFNWSNVKVGTSVIVTTDDKEVPGEFLGKRSSWLDVKINGEKKSVRAHELKLAGV